MPELPEVETTRRGLSRTIAGLVIDRVSVRESRLRWPVSPDLERLLPQQVIDRIERRAKYLLIRATHGTLIVHLGMSGSLRVTSSNEAPEKHDHLDLIFSNGLVLRYRDPRRFGSVLWTSDAPALHPLLKNLGPEPLGPDFDAAHLFETSRGRRVAIKNLLMNSQIVVGVGNIYANEALYLSGIHPVRAAGRISMTRYETLAGAIRSVLSTAIDAGGTTLRDFTNSDGEPGYFSQRLHVYGCGGLPCDSCGATIRAVVIGQRSTFYCPRCQH